MTKSIKVNKQDEFLSNQIKEMINDLTILTTRLNKLENSFEKRTKDITKRITQLEMESSSSETE